MNTQIIITAGELAAVVGLVAILAAVAIGLLVNWVNERHFAAERERQARRRQNWAGMAKEARSGIEGRA